MERNYLIDRVYRNIYVFNFLETSLSNWTSILNENTIEKNLLQQELFRNKNDGNLINYQTEEEIGGNYTDNINIIKIEIIRD